MPNTCTICRHEDREQIESALARGESLRIIANQFGVGNSSVQRHQTCIAAELKALKASRSKKLNETLLERLDRYRSVAEQFLDNDEEALAALDRCYKQVDIEAKLTGEYQKKQENKPDAQRRHEIIVEAYCQVFEQKTLDEAIAAIRAIYEAPDEQSRRLAIKAALEADKREVEAVWLEAEQKVNLRESTMIH
jgi:hypothetical protein